MFTLFPIKRNYTIHLGIATILATSHYQTLEVSLSFLICLEVILGHMMLLLHIISLLHDFFLHQSLKHLFICWCPNTTCLWRCSCYRFHTVGISTPSTVMYRRHSHASNHSSDITSFLFIYLCLQQIREESTPVLWCQLAFTSHSHLI